MNMNRLLLYFPKFYWYFSNYVKALIDDIVSSSNNMVDGISVMLINASISTLINDIIPSSNNIIDGISIVLVNTTIGITMVSYCIFQCGGCQFLNHQLHVAYTQVLLRPLLLLVLWKIKTLVFICNVPICWLFVAILYWSFKSIMKSIWICG